MNKDNLILLDYRQCTICLDYKEDVDEMCPNRHLYCNTCINELYEMIIISRGSVSSKCTLCNEEYFLNKLDAILTANVKLALIKYNIFEEFDIPDNLQLIKCPACPTDPGIFLISKSDINLIQFYKCQKEDCLKTSCLFCYKQIDNSHKHTPCKKYLSIALEIQYVIDKTINICPKCKNKLNDPFPGTKDQGCTHIKCKKCNMDYCYFCGGHQETVDKSGNVEYSPMFRHNEQWESIDSRCPVFVCEISKIVKEWPDDEVGAISYFDNYKLMAFMNRLIKKYSYNVVKEVYDIYSQRFHMLPNNVLYDENNYKSFKEISFVDKKIFKNYI